MFTIGCFRGLGLELFEWVWYIYIYIYIYIYKWANSNSSIWAIGRTLLAATTSSEIGPESNGNEGVLLIAQNSSITGAPQLECFVSYQKTH